MARQPKPLAPPTMLERAAAATSAREIEAALAGDSWGEESVAFLTLSRPRRHVTLQTWSRVPGLARRNGAYCHDLLPGWQYTRAEIQSEMISDLKTLAERGERPTEATR